MNNFFNERIFEYSIGIFNLIISLLTLVIRGVPIWEFWVLPIPIMFLSKSTDTDHQSDIDLAYVKQ